MQRPPRYGWVAPFYDLVSFEWPVYRAGRVAGVKALGLQSGDCVADIGCGTGLCLPLLREAVGRRGRIVGVDASPRMLRQAAGRIASAGWANVDLVRADAAEPGALATALQSAEGSDGEAAPLDGAVFVYSLSLMSAWPQVWADVLSLTRPGGRLAVVDMADPVGAAAVWRPLARLACRIGGSSIDAHPWSALEHDLVKVTALSLRGGHLQVRVGTKPA